MESPAIQQFMQLQRAFGTQVSELKQLVNRRAEDGRLSREDVNFALDLLSRRIKQLSARKSQVQANLQGPCADDPALWRQVAELENDFAALQNERGMCIRWAAARLTELRSSCMATDGIQLIALLHLHCLPP